jgi:Family of unknown function (DUF5372)
VLLAQCGPVAQARSKQTTHLFQESSGFVTVTHPYHPLYGQKVEVVRVRRGVDPDLIIRHPDGFHMAIAMSCTDSAEPSPLRPQDLAPPVLLDFAGLCQMAQFIEELRHLGRLSHEDCGRDSGQSAL